MTQHHDEHAGFDGPVGSPVRFVDPRHGTHEPTVGTPPRRPRSVRRTTTIDAHRPGDFAGELVLAGRGRDLVTDAGGVATVAATGSIDLVVEYRPQQLVRSLVTAPAVPGSQALVGKAASGGFRGVLNREVDVAPGSLVYLLLDDVPGSTLVSGYAMVFAIHRGEVDGDALLGPVEERAIRKAPELCAGYQLGGVIQAGLAKDGLPPLVTGPDAPSVLDPDDELGWHEVGPLSTRDMRRARRHDLWRGPDGHLYVDAFFRDSHVDGDGVETVVHEYTLEAVVDGEQGTVRSCRATPRVLPWLECPQAVDSARRVEGMAVGGLRTQVRAELVGTSTCTHLNDTLRELEDVLALAPLLPA